MIITAKHPVKVCDIQSAYKQEFASSFEGRADENKVVNEISLTINNKGTVTRYGIPRNGLGDSVMLTNGFTKNWVINTLFRAAPPLNIAVLTDRLSDEIRKDIVSDASYPEELRQKFQTPDKLMRIAISYSPSSEEMRMIVDNALPVTITGKAFDKIIREYSLAS